MPSLVTLFLLFLGMRIDVPDIESASEDQHRSISGNNTDIEAASQFLLRYDELLIQQAKDYELALWNYHINSTEYNRKQRFNQSLIEDEIIKRRRLEASSFAWQQFQGKDDRVYEKFKSILGPGSPALSKEKSDELRGSALACHPSGPWIKPRNERKQRKQGSLYTGGSAKSDTYRKLFRLDKLSADIGDVYRQARFCPFNSTQNLVCNLTHSDVQEINTIPGNYEVMSFYWTQYADTIGKKLRRKFIRKVELNNESAKLNGFSDEGENWRSHYKSATFREDMENVWKKLRPLYQQLHAYVRKRLIAVYPGRIRPDGPIPSHIFGSDSQWQKLFDMVNPYPEKAPIDVTDVMVEKNMTALQMFKMAEAFFVSLGLPGMPRAFYNNSVIEKPTDREFHCSADAWSMGDVQQARIKMCTKVNQADFALIHHEMGHVEYDLMYDDQPREFKDAANDGFNEAVGDTMAMSSITPKHLHQLGLLKELQDDHEVDINFLMKVALEKLAFLPHGYLADVYKWQLFDGTIKKEELNAKWWETKLKYQGICPPGTRDESSFDGGTREGYIRYFVGHVIQYQFHKALCNASGHQGALHKCDICGSKEAGKLLGDMMSLGSSVHWGEAMKVITQGHSDKVDAGPLLEYFAPLMEWLQEENKLEFIGWKSDDPLSCPPMKKQSEE